jgi:hypothetical protein
MHLIAKIAATLAIGLLLAEARADILWGYGPDAERDRIQLHDSPCTIAIAGTERIPFVPVNGRKANHATMTRDDGPSFVGCWALMMMNDVPHVILKWSDGDNGHLLLANFHRPKQ